MTTRDDILRVLPGPDEPPISIRTVWERVGQWSMVGVGARLREMLRDGIVEIERGQFDRRRGTQSPSLFRRRRA